MASKPAYLSVLFFFLRFILIIPFCLLIWWLALLPVVAWCWGEAAGAVLLILTSLPIESMEIAREGFLNTATTLTFVIDGTRSSINIADLSTNMAPFVALVLATRGLSLRRRLTALGVGVAILFVLNGAFIVMALAFKESIPETPELPMAFGQFLKTMPFILWAMLAYWGRVSELWVALGNGNESPPEGQASAE